MSHPSRPRASGPAHRRPRMARLETIVPLEQRQLLAPFVTVLPQVATYTPVAGDHDPECHHEPRHRFADDHGGQPPVPDRAPPTP